MTDDERLIDHHGGCMMDPEPHVHIIRHLAGIPAVDVGRDVATTHRPEVGGPVVIDRPPAGAGEVARRLAHRHPDPDR